MKTMKQTACVLLSVLLLIGLMPLSVCIASASETAIELTLGEEVTVVLAEGESKWYSFTPHTSKRYVFSSLAEENVDPMATLYNSSMEAIAQNDDYDGANFRVSAYLAAGETYYFEAYEFEKNQIGSYTLVVEVALPDDVWLDEYSITLFQGVEYALGWNIYPEEADDTVTWTSSNASVVTVDDTGKLCAVSAGEATISVETPNGLRDTCWVTVKPVAGTSTLNTEMEIVAVGGLEERAESEQTFSFTPEESGYYCLYSYDILSETEDCEVDPRVWVRNEIYEEIEFDDDGGEDVNVRVQVALQAGETYYFTLELYDAAAAGSYKAKIEKMITAESVSIDCGDLVMDQGTLCDIYVTYSPEGCWQEDYTVTSSDPSVVDVQDKTILAVGAGEATVTVTTDLGLTDSITVEVLGANELELDTLYTLEGVAADYGANARYVFTPTESGVYTIALSVMTGELAEVSVSVSDGYDQLHYNNTDSDRLELTYELVAGETYYYEVSLECESEESSVAFMLKKADMSSIPVAEIYTDYTIDIQTPGSGAYYVFKPRYTGLYAIYATPGEKVEDTKLNVFNSNWELFYSDDDAGGNGQYLLEEEFTAGETYYLKSFFYRNDIIGSHTMRIEPLFDLLDGDINADNTINMMDAFLLYQAVSSGDYTEAIELYGDITGDGAINIMDAFEVYRIAAGV